jgi:AcrR family transcriptional regulator
VDRRNEEVSVAAQPLADVSRTGRGRPRGSYAKSEQTRATILDAALEVFALGGYRAGSLRDIAAKVGMSEAGLLHHFSSKSGLLAAVLERRDDLARQFVPPHPGDGIQAMQGLIALARFNASEPGVVELYCTLSAEATTPGHPAHEYFVRRYETTRATLTEAFADLDARGLLRPGFTPELAAHSAVAIMDGLQVQWLMDRSVIDMAQELKQHIELLTLIEF